MLTNKEMQNLVLLELMSPDPYSENEPLLSEDERKAIHNRWKEDIHSNNWGYILEPIADLTTKSRFITLLQQLDHE